MTRVRATVLSDEHASSLVEAMVPAFAEGAGLSEDDEQRFRDVVARLVAFTLDNAYPGDDLGEIEVTLESGDGCVHVLVHDWGLPLTSAGGELGPLPQALAGLTDASNVQLLNLGAEGKRLSADVAVSSAGAPDTVLHHVEAAPRRARVDADEAGALEVRRATSEDTEAIAQLLYENYQLSYVHADFYRPRYLLAALASGELHSTVAVHEGRIVGHHALMPLAGCASAETGAAVVHSAYRGLGIFGRLFEHTLESARELGLASAFGDAVTIHPFSQRAELAHGYRETALQLAMVPARTTMRGFGGDGPGMRTATLRSYRVFDETPRPAKLPAPYRELLETIYAHVGVRLETAAEPDRTPSQAVEIDTDEGRGLGFLRLGHWDDGSAGLLKRSARHLLSQHVDVLYADVDLVGTGDLDEAVAALNELGFFAAGLLLHGPDGHDHLRLQRLDSEDVELEQIVCDSPFAQELKRQVLADLARVGG